MNMVEISMEDLFYGFVRNYHSFGIRSKSKWAKWTNEILGFYARLGRMLGNYVEYEWKYYDLTWFWELDEDPWFHIEHENAADRLFRLMEKVKESIAYNIIIIGYPGSVKDQEEFIAELENVKREERRKEILAIMDASFYEDFPISLTGYVLEFGKKTVALKAKKLLTEDGFYYAAEE